MEYVSKYYLVSALDITVLLLEGGEKERSITLWYPSIKTKTGVSSHFVTRSNAICECLRSVNFTSSNCIHCDNIFYAIVRDSSSQGNLSVRARGTLNTAP